MTTSTVKGRLVARLLLEFLLLVACCAMFIEYARGQWKPTWSLMHDLLKYLFGS